MKYFALDRRGELVPLGDHACIGDAMKSCSFRFITVMDEGGVKFWLERQSKVVSGEQILRNPHFKAAYRDYMQAREAVKQGLMANCHMQREYLRSVYRVVAGKVV